jgi:lysophospholipase L1-like esterase
MTASGPVQRATTLGLVLLGLLCAGGSGHPARADDLGGTAYVRAWATAPSLRSVGESLDAKPQTTSRLLLPGAKVFRYFGAVSGPIPGPYGKHAYHGLGVSVVGADAWSVGVTSTGSGVTFRLAAGKGYAYRVRVDRSPGPARFLPLSGWHVYNLNLHFNRPATRTLVLELAGYGSDFLGAYDAKDGQLRYPHMQLGPRTIAVGDSWTSGWGSPVPFDGYVQTMGRVLGLGDIWASSVGATGYLTKDFSMNFAERLDTDVLRYRPSTVIVAGGSLDLGRFTTQEIGAAANALFEKIRAALPAVHLIVLGPWVAGGSVWPGLIQVRDAIHAAALANGGAFIDTTQWFTGSGNVTAPKGDGNADTFIGPISGHPNLAGYQYLGMRLAAALQRLPHNAGRG